MTVIPTQMFLPTVLTTSPATLFTSNIGATTGVFMRGRIRFANTSASAVTVNAWGIPSGGTEANGNNFCPNQSIPAGQFLDVDVPVLAFGGFIQASASAASAVTAHSLDGVLFT